MLTTLWSIEHQYYQQISPQRCLDSIQHISLLSPWGGILLKVQGVYPWSLTQNEIRNPEYLEWGLGLGSGIGVTWDIGFRIWVIGAISFGFGVFGI